MPDDPAITRDTLLRGRVKLLQPRDGYRSSLDPVLLAAFITPPFGHFLDIGCGTGALSFLLLAHDPEATGVGVELQARLAALAEQSRDENRVASRWRLVAADVRQPGLLAPASFDLVAANPPFRPVGTGVLPPEREKAVAHHEVSLTLRQWLDVAARVLRPGGRLATIFPFDRWGELRTELAARGLAAGRLRLVVPRSGSAPGRVLIEARRGSGGLREESPLVVHEAAGYTAEVKRMLGEDA
jgi:tRNA1Val (adenine37-N6)-methyltransferase